MSAWCRGRRVIAASLLWLVVVCPPVAAQQSALSPPASPDTGIRALVGDIFGDFRALPSRDNIKPALVGTGLSLAAHTIDDDVNQHFEGTGGVHDFFLPGRIIGQDAVQIGAGVAAYAIGRLTDHTTVTEVGMDILRVQALNGVVTLALKEAVGRERPDGSDHYSFPSGHASVTFATATVLERRFGWRVGIPMYVVAAYTAASRLHENKHYLSDVVAGATVGCISGRTVMRHGRSDYALVPVLQHKGAALLLVRVW